MGISNNNDTPAVTTEVEVPSTTTTDRLLEATSSMATAGRVQVNNKNENSDNNVKNFDYDGMEQTNRKLSFQFQNDSNENYDKSNVDDGKTTQATIKTSETLTTTTTLVSSTAKMRTPTHKTNPTVDNPTVDNPTVDNPTVDNPMTPASGVLLRGFGQSSKDENDGNDHDNDRDGDHNSTDATSAFRNLNTSPKKNKYSLLDAWNLLEEEVLLEQNATTLLCDSNNTKTTNVDGDESDKSNNDSVSSPTIKNTKSTTTRDRIAWAAIVRDDTLLLSIPHKNTLSKDVTKVAHELLTVTSQQTNQLLDPSTTNTNKNNKALPTGWDTNCGSLSAWNWYGYRGIRFPVYQRGLSSSSNKKDPQQTKDSNDLSVWMFLCVYDTSPQGGGSSGNGNSTTNSVPSPLNRRHRPLDTVKAFMEQEMIQMTHVMRQFDPRWRDGYHYACQQSFAPILLQVLHDMNVRGTDYVLSTSGSSSPSSSSSLCTSVEAIIKQNRTLMQQHTAALQQKREQQELLASSPPGSQQSDSFSAASEDDEDEDVLINQSHGNDFDNKKQQQQLATPTNSKRPPAFLFHQYRNDNGPPTPQQLATGKE